MRLEKTNGPVSTGPFFPRTERFPALKTDLRAQLDDARITRAGDLAKGAGAERCVQRRVVGVVESIERFKPEL